jgi:hypothetical protein
LAPIESEGRIDLAPTCEGLDARCGTAIDPSAPVSGWFVIKTFPPLLSTTKSRCGPTKFLKRERAASLAAK